VSPEKKQILESSIDPTDRVIAMDSNVRVNNERNATTGTKNRSICTSDCYSPVGTAATATSSKQYEHSKGDNNAAKDARKVESGAVDYVRHVALDLPVKSRKTG
jgi:hypothetical protein